MYVTSAVNAPANKVPSWASATVPSNIIPFDVLTVSTLLVVVVPVTCKSPSTVKSLPIVTSFGRPIVNETSVPDLVTAVTISFVVPIILRSSSAKDTSWVVE